MDQNPVVIAGTGAEAKIALEIFSGQDIVVYGFVSDDEEKVPGELNDVTIFAHPQDEAVNSILHDDTVDFFVAEGDVKRRKELAVMLVAAANRPPTNAIHRTASIATYAKLGCGNFVNAFACLDPNCEILDYNYIHSQVSIGTDAKIGSYNTIERGVRIGGNAEIGDDVFIGTGAVIYPGVKVKNGAVIGAGSVVVKEVKANSTVFGNPAEAAK